MADIEPQGKTRDSFIDTFVLLVRRKDTGLVDAVPKGLGSLQFVTVMSVIWRPA